MIARLRATARRLWARRQTRDPEPEASRIWVPRLTPAGVRVSADTALANSVVWACVRYLSQSVAQLPWRVMAERPGGGAERQPLHPLDWVLHRRPNPEQGSFTWRESMLGQALIRGNAYAEIQRDGAERVIALWPLRPDRVTPRRLSDETLAYEVSNGAAGSVILSARDVFHLRGFGDGPVGLNVIDYAAASIGWAQATQLFGASFFAHGATPAGVVETPQALSPQGLKLLREAFEAAHQGAAKAHRTMFLDAGMKWTKTSVEPDKAQFVETMQHQVEEICRWFGVPPHKVMHLLRATFTNIEHQSIEVVVDSVTPWVRRFEEEADYKLFGRNRAGLFTKMNLNALLRGDSTARAAFYKTMREMGVYSANRILELEDENPVGPDGDKLIVPLNMTTLARVGEEPPPPAGPPAAGGEGEDETDDADMPAMNAGAKGASDGRRLPH